MILINDITLRDGEQAAGVNFFPREKLKIAEQFVKLGLKIIEAGFPIASKQDIEGVSLIAKEFGNDIIVSAMCRANKKDIEVASEALGSATKRRIQVVMGTSDIHLKHKFNMTREQARDLSVDMVKYALTFSPDVEFAAEDASRSDRDYLVDVCTKCVQAGAKTIELPDTVGYSLPADYAEMIRGVVVAVKDRAIVSTHCHDDLGLAVANTLAGILAGAKQAETTFNGIGERVGNAATEEVIMAMKTRADIFNDAVSYVNTKEIINTSKLVEQLSKITTAHNKAIVGRGAFLHESGIHQDGLLKSPLTYQILDPKDVGLAGYQLLLGKLSGKNALKDRLTHLGKKLDDDELNKFSHYFKEYASKRKFIVDDDILNLFERFQYGR